MEYGGYMLRLWFPKAGQHAQSKWLVNGTNPESKVHGTNMGPIWGRQDPDGPHVGPMNFAIWEALQRQLVAKPDTRLQIIFNSI